MANVKRIKEQTVCMHCQKLLKDPRLLPCLHSYCTACLLKFVKEDEDLICPTCFENHGIKEVPNLHKDVLGESLISMGRTGDEEQTLCSSCTSTEEAVDRCLNCCEFLCNECSSIHRRMRLTRDHEIITLKDYGQIKEDEQVFHRSLFCDEHPNEELRYFCEKCKQIVCRECTVVVHKSHKYRYMEQSNTVKEIVDMLKSLAAKVQSKVTKAQKALDDVNATTDLITASIAGLKNSVHNTATEMVRHIRLAEEEMITEIDRVQSRKFHGLKQQTKQLQNVLETFEYGKFYVEHALKYLSEVELYLLREPIGNRLKVLNKKKISHDPVEENNLKHVRETWKARRLAKKSLGYLEVNGNLVINGCVRDLNDFKKHNVAISEPSPDLKGIRVDIRGPGGEILSPTKTERENPGSYGADFQSERPGTHSVLVTVDGVPVQGSPIDVVLGKPAVSPASSSPPASSSRSLRSNPKKPGELWDVHGIAIGKEGQIVVTDSKCHRVQIFDKTGKFLRMFGGFGSENSQFDCPHGVAVNKLDEIIIADTVNARIQIFDKYGKYLRCISCNGKDDEIFRPYDVTLDLEDNIVALEREKSKVRVYSKRGDIITEFGSVGSGDGQFINPSYATVNKSGHVIVSDLGNDRIQVFTKTGQSLLKFGRSGQGNGELCWPTGIAVKGNGDIIVADSCNDRIQMFRADGCFASCIGPLDCSTENKIKSPEGLTVDEHDVIYVADWGNNRVQIY